MLWNNLKIERVRYCWDAADLYKDVGMIRVFPCGICTMLIVQSSMHLISHINAQCINLVLTEMQILPLCGYNKLWINPCGFYKYETFKPSVFLFMWRRITINNFRRIDFSWRVQGDWHYVLQTFLGNICNK